MKCFPLLILKSDLIIFLFTQICFLIVLPIIHYISKLMFTTSQQIIPLVCFLLGELVM